MITKAHEGKLFRLISFWHRIRHHSKTEQPRSIKVEAPIAPRRIYEQNMILNLLTAFGLSIWILILILNSPVLAFKEVTKTLRKK